MNVVDVEPYEDSVARGAWSASCWLQEGYTVSHRLATESVASAAGPLTGHMHAEDFTDFQVPFGTSVFAFFGVLILLLAAHELYTAASKKPLLADHERSNNFRIQFMFLIIWFGFFVNSSLIVPLSLDYAIAMGQSATASGVFLGCGTTLSVVGLIVGKSLNSETNWNQAFARKTYICFNSLSIALNLSLAFLTQASVHWSLPARQQFFWWSQLLLGSVFGAAALPTISWNTLWNKITPPQEKTFWMIMAQCCRNGGFLLGPPLFAAISWAVRRGRDVSPISLMAWSFMALAGWSLLSLMYASLTFPLKINPLPETPAEVHEKKSAQALEVSPEQLPPADREKIVWLMIYYAFERPFSVASIEVATIMLLEVSYGWTAEFCGTAFMVIATSSLALTACSTFMLSSKLMTESMVFFAASLSGLFGVFLLFGNSGPGSLLLADAIVYGGASVANGIGEGWACRAATPGTSYSIEAFRVRNIMGVNISRFLAPIAARFIVDFGGRNIYALLQLVLCTLGTLTVYKTVSLVWQGTCCAEEALDAKLSLNTEDAICKDASDPK
ncbi:unnamed protein product [Symbiodinium natans]|uniref:Uncharacterized protein n=1 Tax=Symbiodinium natans TaxID=878477 RepID=A0A812JAY9_9DINO|nr:unnamed protein product [Symbiodinium natans]